MNRKEINEIKSLFDTIEESGIIRLAGCYVNGDKEKVKTFQERFANLPDEEKYKYLEVFRKTLSGTVGRHLLDVAFTEKGQDDASCGKALLNRLRRSELKEEGILEEFYDRVIESYDHEGNYLILLINQDYDVPGVTADGMELEDASDEVYKYILCSICPMKLTKPGLGFDDALGEIHTLKQIFAVDLPETGFLFPAFNERSADEDALLYSSRKVDFLQNALLDRVLSVSVTLPARQQKEGFQELITDVLGEHSDFDTVIAIQENLNETVKNKKMEMAGEPIFLEKEEMRTVFEKSGVPDDQLDIFEKKYDEQFDVKKYTDRNKGMEPAGEEERQDLPWEEEAAPAVRIEEKLLADNVAPVRNLEIRNENMLLRIRSSCTDMIGTRTIDGKKYLVIELTDELTVNGIPVNA